MYDQIGSALGAYVSAEERTKPSCCDDKGAAPVDEEAAEAVFEAVERSARHVRRRR